MSGLTLFLNAAEQRLQFALIHDGELLCAQDWAAASQGAELLVPALHDALSRLALSPSALDRIACVAGPGSFTGLRLALTTASALHQSLGVPVAALNTLELLAEGCPCSPGTVVRVAIHARRDVVCLQDFIRQPHGVIPLNPPRSTSPEAIGQGLDALSSGPVILIGSGLTRHIDALSPLPASALPLPHACDMPVSAAILRLVARAEYLHTDPAPLYLRDSEAEDNLESLAARRGDDPAATRAALVQFLAAKPVSSI